MSPDYDFETDKVKIYGEYLLRGTLTVPVGKKARWPAVLLIPGAGNIDRDGNEASFKFKLNLYKGLVHFISRQGFAVLRYDKRGVGESKGNFLSAGMWDMVNDAGSCINFLKEQSWIDPEKIVVLGHSEGATLAVAYCARNPVAGLVLLAGSFETLEESLKRQRELIYTELRKAKGLRGIIFRLMRIEQKEEKKSGELMDLIRRSNKDVLHMQNKAINAKWIREHLYYNIRRDLPKIGCPVLAAAGSNDFQSDPGKLKNLPALIGRDVTVRVIEKMNHPLRESDKYDSLLDMKGLYQRSSRRPLHPELKALLKSWLSDLFKT